jgi:hypothetical protein
MAGKIEIAREGIDRLKKINFLPDDKDVGKNQHQPGRPRKVCAVLEPELVRFEGAARGDRDDAFNQKHQHQDEKTGGEKTQDALPDEGPIIAGSIIFFIEHQCHVKARNHEETLDRQISVEEPKPENTLPVHVRRQHGKGEQHSEHSHRAMLIIASGRHKSKAGARVPETPRTGGRRGADLDREPAGRSLKARRCCRCFPGPRRP